MGLEFARQLAESGYRVMMVSNREAELQDAAKAITADFGVQAEALCIDLASEGSAESVLGWCDSLGLEVDVLVNNAGCFFMKYLEPADLPRVRTMMSLHMDVVTELCVLVGDRMKRRGSGHILNMSSMTARIPAPGISIYSATKAYLKSFGKSFSHEMRPYGVYVTTVCPSAVDTGLYPLGDKLRRVLKRCGIIRSPEWLVRKALRALFGGRRTLSPGLTNALLPPLIAIAPDSLIDKLGVRWIAR